MLEEDTADLTLRRALALLANKPEPLEDLVPSVAEALAQPRWVGAGRPPSATLLDSGAAWLHADGTVTERIRTLETPLDETALSSLGELELPGGAALLALRTHKRDGRVLDADAQVGGEKHTVSAASLEVGDTLEIDYLVSSPPPPPRRRQRGRRLLLPGRRQLAAPLHLPGAGRRGSRRWTPTASKPAKTVSGSITVERTKVAAVAETQHAPAERVLSLGPGGHGQPRRPSPAPSPTS